MAARRKQRHFIPEDVMAMIERGWGEREKSVRGSRWPVQLAERVKRIAEETDNDWTETVYLLVNWACDEYERRKKAAGAKIG